MALRKALGEGIMRPKAGESKKNFYKRYMNSSEWRVQRRRYWSLEGVEEICLGCSMSRSQSRKKSGCDLDLHHISYTNLGNEKIGDLIPLCRECHDVVHDTLPSWKQLQSHTEKVIVQIRSGVIQPGKKGKKGTCWVVKKNGEPCRGKPQRGQNYCGSHLKRSKKRRGKGQGQKKRRKRQRRSQPKWDGIENVQARVDAVTSHRKGSS